MAVSTAQRDRGTERAGAAERDRTETGTKRVPRDTAVPLVPESL